MARVIQCVDRVLDSQVPLLIEGESGTGKENLVQIIHENGPLADKPLVSISCGSFSPDILESQLFGHVKGAFTGALADQEGLLVKAHGGTLFLDEVTDLPLEIQVKFLRFLQEWEILPLGGNQTRKIKVRLITSTRQNLQEWIQKGLFREDLFNRLNVIQIHLPPLRERREDIPLFIEHFLKKYDLSQKLQFADQALKALYYAPWPGNIRQLENHLQMLCSMKLRRKITLKDLPQEIRNPKSVLPATNYEEAQDHFLRDYLKNLIQFAQGNITQAIKISGIPRTTLYRHLKRLFGVHFAEELGLN
jgi:two-component system response regulator GlrR